MGGGSGPFILVPLFHIAIVFAARLPPETKSHDSADLNLARFIPACITAAIGAPMAVLLYLYDLVVAL